MSAPGIRERIGVIRALLAAVEAELDELADDQGAADRTERYRAVITYDVPGATPPARDEASAERVNATMRRIGQPDGPAPDDYIRAHLGDLERNVCPECGVSWAAVSPACPRLYFDRHAKA